MTDKELSAKAQKAYHLFRQFLPAQVTLHEILRSLGKCEDQECLDVGTGNGMISYHLRRHGGRWQTAAESGRTAESILDVVEESVCTLDNAKLPFENKTFDVTVVVDFLEKVREDSAFIEECHRVLRPDGRLVLNVTRLKGWTPIDVLRKLLGETRELGGRARAGYTESQLFTLLKDGFDVHHVRSYSRFFVQFVETWVNFALRRGAEKSGGDEKDVSRVYAIASPFFRLAFQLDMLLFATRGHRMIAVAKRRAWRPRNTPILVDGRSISEAVLSKAVD